MNAAQRRLLELAADRILAANPEPRPASVRVRYRGGRPAMNWLAKRDPEAAAALWLVARRRLPPEADNDNQPAQGLGADRTKDGRARGPRSAPRDLEAYLALPSVQPRFGDEEPQPVIIAGNWDGESRNITIKPQRDIFEFHADCRFGFCAPAIAEGAIFLGAIGGLGQPKAGKTRGDRRRVEEPPTCTPPDEVDIVIETVLSGGNVADVGRAVGAKGGYADRRGSAALLAAGKWAQKILAA